MRSAILKDMIDGFQRIQDGPVGDEPTKIAEVIDHYVTRRLLSSGREAFLPQLAMTAEQEHEAALMRLNNARDGRGLMVHLKPTRDELYRLCQALAPNAVVTDFDPVSINNCSLQDGLRRKRDAEMALVRNIQLVAEAYWHELRAGEDSVTKAWERLFP